MRSEARQKEGHRECAWSGGNSNDNAMKFMNDSDQRNEEDVPIFVTVHDPREDVVRVCAGADEKEDDQEERLKIEEGGLEISAFEVITIRITALTILTASSMRDLGLQLRDGSQVSQLRQVVVGGEVVGCR